MTASGATVQNVVGVNQKKRGRAARNGQPRERTKGPSDAQDPINPCGRGNPAPACRLLWGSEVGRRQRLHARGKRRVRLRRRWAGGTELQRERHGVRRLPVPRGHERRHDRNRLGQRERRLDRPRPQFVGPHLDRGRDLDHGRARRWKLWDLRRWLNGRHSRGKYRLKRRLRFLWLRLDRWRDSGFIWRFLEDQRRRERRLDGRRRIG